MLGFLLKKFDKYYKTCPITHVKNRCVTFIRDRKYLPFLKNVTEDIWLIDQYNLED